MWVCRISDEEEESGFQQIEATREEEMLLIFTCFSFYFIMYMLFSLINENMMMGIDDQGSASDDTPLILNSLWSHRILYISMTLLLSK